MNDVIVDFDAPIYRDHPSGWQSPRDLAEAFLLAAALELEARWRLDRQNPFGPEVFAALPSEFWFDPFGSRAFVQASFARLPLLELTWRLVDEVLADNELLRQQDPYGNYARAIEPLKHLRLDKYGVVLFTEALNRRWFHGDSAVGLTDVEQAYVRAEPIPGRPSGVLAPDGGLYISSVWQVAFRLVERRGPLYFIDMYAHRIPTVRSILYRGSLLGLGASNKYQLWPGWPDLR